MPDWLLFAGIGLVALEGTLAALVFWLRRDCAWIITQQDLTPEIDADGLNAFLEHGWDKELGWVRKPNTRYGEIGKEKVRTSYSLDRTGARGNPGFEDQPPSVLAYGDSYTFARQVNDHEAWPNLLSKMIKANVGNYGVGNYGLDQALLRLEREFDDHPVPVIIMGLVPETISRTLSVWKHFSEYGNTFGFKPRFVLNDDGLELLPNVIDNPEKFFRIPEYLDRLKAEDYFYAAKFARDILHFPFLWRLAYSWRRNLPLMAAALTDKLGLTKERAFLQVMERNIDLAAGLYRNSEASALFKSICRRFIDFAKDRDAEPVLVMMPQLLDLDHIRKGDHYYKHILDELALEMTVVDLAPALLEQDNTESLFIHDRYGGHLSVEGNKIVAELLTEICRGLLRRMDKPVAEDRHVGYPYASGDLLENRNTYFFTAYGGHAFLEAWRRDRSAYLGRLPAAAKPPSNNAKRVPETGVIGTRPLLDRVYGAILDGDVDDPAIRGWLDKLVKKLETTKRIHNAYDAAFRAIDHEKYKEGALYVRLAEVFEAAYAATSELPYLNALLKCMDTLCSLSDRLPSSEQARLSWLVARENAHINTLAAKQGVSA